MTRDVIFVIEELRLEGVEPGDALVHDSLARALAPALGEHGLEGATEPLSAAVSAAVAEEVSTRV